MLTITLDGPAGSGKGTIARFLSNAYHLRHLETGLLYRWVALYLRDNALDPGNELTLLNAAEALSFNFSNPELRSEIIGNIASQIAVCGPLRTKLTNHMRSFIKETHPPYCGVVLDGRDTGTVVCPTANIKFFITADPLVRQQRRIKDLSQKGLPQDVTTLNERDRRDLSRKDAPLIPPVSAITLDTTHLSRDETFDLVCEHVHAYLKSHGL